MHNTELLIRMAIRAGLRDRIIEVATNRSTTGVAYTAENGIGTMFVQYFDLDGEPGFNPEVVITVECQHKPCDCCGMYRSNTYRVSAAKYSL